MPERKEVFSNENFYHVYNKSIAGYIIFNIDKEYNRFMDLIKYYRFLNTNKKYSKTTGEDRNSIYGEPRVDLISYCIMPTHYHFILKQKRENGIKEFIYHIQQSYALYFNKRHKRSGPLWEGRFKSVLIKTNEQLEHLTRYIHLNPVTAYIVSTPQEWKYSSYLEYIRQTKENLCNFSEYISMSDSSYKRFVEEQINWQRELAKIKHLIME